MQAKEFNFWPGGEKIQREGPLAGGAALRPAGQGSRRIERAKVDLRPEQPKPRKPIDAGGGRYVD